MACSRLLPHMSTLGCSEVQTAGRSARPKRRQRSSRSSCTQRTPAGLPAGMPGIGEVIEGAVQQAPQAGRQIMRRMLSPAFTGRRVCAGAKRCVFLLRLPRAGLLPQTLSQRVSP